MLHQYLRRYSLVGTIVVLAGCVESSEDVIASTSNPTDEDAYVRELVNEIIGPDPLLPIIFACETTGTPHRIRHRNEDGGLLKNPTSSASGYAQVLLQFHGDWIAETGLNMQDDREYTEFVRILF